MDRTSHPTNGRSAPPATFVVVLTFESVYRGMVGPLPSEAAARSWAVEHLDGRPGWSWTIEPVVAPTALPAAERLARRAPARHLALVR